MSRDFGPVATTNKLGRGLLVLLVTVAIALVLAPAAAQAESYLAEDYLDNESGSKAIHWSIDQDGKLVIKTLESEWVGSPNAKSVGWHLPPAKPTFPYYPWQEYAESIISAEIAVGKAYIYYDSDVFGQPDAQDVQVDSYVRPTWLDRNRLEYLFYGLKNMRTVSLAGLDPTGLTSTQGMFEGCASLMSIDFTGCATPFSTSLVDDMRSMFKGCESLVQIKGLEDFDTSNVVLMSSMFEDCASLPSLDIRHFSTSKVTDMNSMFAGCESLTTLDVSNMDTSQALSLHGMFEGCKNLATIKGVEALDTTGVAANGWGDLYAMFQGCASLKSLDLSGYDFSKTSRLGYLLEGCSALESVKLPATPQAVFTDMSSMFAYCSSLQSVDLTGLDTSHVTDMRDLFYGCKALSELDLSSLTTGAGADLTRMMAGCTGLKSVKLAGADLSQAQRLDYLFASDESLTSVDLGAVTATSATSMAYMFRGCTSLTGLDLSGFGTPAATDMREMFKGCTSLTRLSVSGLDTTNVTKMDDIFAQCFPAGGECVLTLGQNSAFTSANTGLTGVWANEGQEFDAADITTGFTAAKAGRYTQVDAVTDSGTIGGCEWRIVSGSQLVIAPAADGDAILGDTEGKGVYYWTHTWDEHANAITSLRIEPGVKIAGWGGYHLFNGLNMLVSADISQADTSLCTNFDEMFQDCSSLQRVNLAGLDTRNVQEMREMFRNCGKLKSVDFSTWDLSSLYSGYDVFSGALQDVGSTLVLGPKFAFKVSSARDAAAGLEGNWKASADGRVYPAEWLAHNYKASLAGTFTKTDEPADTEALELEALEALAPGLPVTVSDDEEAERVKDALEGYDALTDVQRQKLSAAARQQFEAARVGLKAYEDEQRLAEEKRQDDQKAVDAFVELMADNYLGSIGSDSAYQQAQQVVAAYRELTEDQRELLDWDAQERYKQLLDDMAEWEEYQDYLAKADAIGRIIEPWNQDSYTAEELKSYYDRATEILDTMSDSQRERFEQTGGWVAATYRDLCEAMRDYDNLVAREAEQALRDELSPEQQESVDELVSTMGSLPADVASDEDAATVLAACDAYAAMSDTQKALLAMKSGKTVEDVDAQFAAAKSQVSAYNEQKGNDLDDPGKPDGPGTDSDNPDDPDAGGSGASTAPGKAEGQESLTAGQTAKPALQSIAKAKVSAILSATYTGNALKPKPTVTLGGKKLKNGTDYTLSYKANTKVGKAIVIIDGKGSYTGSVKASFSIVPKTTSIKKLAKSKKAFTATWVKQAVQVDGYQVRYSLKKNMKAAKSKTVKKAKATKLVVKKLKAKKTYYVQVRTYKKVGGTTYYSAWSKAKSVKTK